MRSSVVVFLLLATIFFLGLVSSQCTSHHGDCTGCTGDDAFQCGFCGWTGECLTGDATGPTLALTESAFGGCPSLWQIDFDSHVIKTERGYPVTPIEADIFLAPNRPTNLIVAITRPFSDDIPVDFVMVQDASGSMGPFIDLFGVTVPKVMARLYADYKSTYFAHNSYVDKPIFDFGSWNVPDYVLQYNTPGLESIPSTMLLAARRAIEGLGYGNDWREDPLGGLAITLDCQTIEKWRPLARKFTFLVTDAPFHPDNSPYTSYSGSDGQTLCRRMCDQQYSRGNYEGCEKNYNRDNAFDNTCAGAPDTFGPSSGSWIDSYCYEPIIPAGASPTPNAGYNFYDNCPFNPRPYDLDCPDSRTTTLSSSEIPYRNQYWATDVDFITRPHMGEKFLTYNTIPIFGVSDGWYNSYVVGEYTDTVNSWGFGAVTRLSTDSDTLVQDILQQIDAVAEIIKLRTTDTGGYVQSITSIGEVDGFTNVQVLDTVEFDVVFQHSTPVDGYEVRLVTLGFPEVLVRIWATVQCFGCDGTPGNYVDLCGICNPVVPNACLGCDGVPYSGATYDACGVCDGNNSACAGCDGIPFSGAEYDICGLCNGDNTTCLGCDGIPFSGARVDSCDVCGGNDSCYGCDFVKNSNLTFDRCGYCGGNDACVGCDGIAYQNITQRKVYDICGVCGGDNDCLGCDGVKDSGLVEDACGICGGDNSSCPIGCDGVRSTFPLVYDQCGVCNGNDSCLGCDYVPFSNATEDDCGVCGGNNECIGCDGVAYPVGVLPPYYDRCGVCNGNDTCLGCDYRPNSGKVVDRCGVCGGKDECLGCDLVPNSGKLLDFCGVCDGNNTCYDCFGVPYGPALMDGCGVCGGNNRSCSGCDDIPYSGATFDSCGVCNGNNSCAYINETPPPPPFDLDTWLPAALITIGVVALIAGILAAVAVLSVGAAVGGTLWALPAGLLSQLSSAQESEIHVARAPRVNPLQG